MVIYFQSKTLLQHCSTFFPISQICNTLTSSSLRVFDELKQI